MLTIPADNRILKRYLCAVLVIITVLAAFELAGPSHGYGCGIDGSVLRLPALPGLSASAEPGTYPHAVIVIQEAKSDRVVSTVTADENGSFSARLAPGRYRISIDGDCVTPHGGSQVQTVEAGRQTHVTVFADERPVAN